KPCEERWRYRCQRWLAKVHSPHTMASAANHVRCHANNRVFKVANNAAAHGVEPERSCAANNKDNTAVELLSITDGASIVTDKIRSVKVAMISTGSCDDIRTWITASSWHLRLER
ncbi:hypothetical protein Dimus_015437, partial [Dionaea muscipula]